MIFTVTLLKRFSCLDSNWRKLFDRQVFIDLPLRLRHARLTVEDEAAMMAKRRVVYETEWDATKIKALREHLGLTQQQLAEELGVRQQTISEWEVGVYAPRRSTSKYLNLIAERAGFAYKVKKI